MSYYSSKNHRTGKRLLSHQIQPHINIEAHLLKGSPPFLWVIGLTVNSTLGIETFILNGFNIKIMSRDRAWNSAGVVCIQEPKTKKMPESI